jgi:hypothetical protein
MLTQNGVNTKFKLLLYELETRNWDSTGNMGKVFLPYLVYREGTVALPASSQSIPRALSSEVKRPK